MTTTNLVAFYIKKILELTLSLLVLYRDIGSLLDELLTQTLQCLYQLLKDLNLIQTKFEEESHVKNILLL